MFGQKSPFGTSTTSAFGNTTGSSLFSQNKPVGVSFGTQQSTPATGGLFGSKLPTPGGLFGASSSTAAPTSTLFGGAPTTAATGGLFGAPSQQQKPLFGATSTGGFGGSSLFGASQTATTATAGGGMFGNTAGGSMFSSAAPSQAGSVIKFDPPIAQDTMMKNNIQQTINTSTAGGTGLFGATSTATTGFSGFGTSTSGGLFGKPTTTTAAPAFGGGFGAQPGGFGTTPAFGQPQAGGGLFSGAAAQQKPAGLFSGPATSAAPGGLFGTAQPAQGAGLFGAASKPGQFSLFNSPATSSAGSFGPPNALNYGGGAMGTTAIQQQQQPISLGTDPGYAAAQHARLQEQIASSPYGDSPLLRLLGKKPSEIGAPVPTDPVAQNRIIRGSVSSPSASYGAAGSSRAPTSFGSNIKASPMPRISSRIVSPLANRSGSFLNKSTNSGIFDDLDDDVALLKEGFVPRKNVKKLFITPKTTRHSMPTAGVAQPMGELSSRRRPTAILADHNAITSPIDNGRDADMRWAAEPPELNLDATGNSTTIRDSSDIRAPRPVRPDTAYSSPVNDCSMTAEQSILMSPRSEDDEPTPMRAEPPPPPHPAGISLSRPGYYTIPSLADLADITGRDGSCIVSDGFTVGRSGYGSVFWAGEADISNLDLDELVHFRHKEVTVYPDETRKPPVGQGLNRRAEVTLERVWPIDKTTRQPIKDAQRLDAMQFRDRLERAAGQMGAVFKDYRAETGSWVFQVLHFSKYGLLDEDDEADGPTKPELARSDVERRTQAAVQRAPWETTPPGKAVKPLAPSNTILSPLTAAKKNQSLGLGGLDSMEDDMFAEQPPLDLAEGVDPEMSGEMSALMDVERMMSSTHKAMKLMLKQSSLFDDYSDYSLKAKDSPLQSSYLRSSKLQHVDILKDVFNRSEALMDHSDIITDGAPGRFLDDQSLRVEAAMAAAAVSLPPATAPQHSFALVPLNESVMAYRERSLIDVSLFNGRRFRVGWAPGRAHFSIVGSGQEKIRSGSDIQLTANFAQQSEQQVVDLSFFAEGSYCFEMMRKQAVSDWLIDASKESLDRDMKTAKGSASVLALMRSGRVDDAVQQAMTQGDCRLALLLASATGCTEGRALCLDQLMQWHKCGADGFIDADRLKTLALLAGQTHWTRVDRDGKQHTLNCCTNLDWRRAFGLYLWYVGAQTDGLLEVVAHFDADVAKGVAPRPTHTVSLKTDLCYHLVKLFVDRSHSLEAVLNPDAYADDPFDYHLSWHLWSALKAIGYCHLAPRKEDMLHTRYAEQLAACGLWHLGVFVLMHIVHDGRRTEAVKEYLSRFAFNCSDEQYDALVTTFSIPTTWLADARCLKAKAEGRKDEEAWAAVEAERWNLAHQLFLQHVGPNAVTSENYDILERFIRRLSAHQVEVHAWPMGGQIYEDFLTLKKELHRLGQLDGAHVDIAVADLKQLLASLASRLDAMRCDQPIERLCQGEMSKTVVHMSRLILTIDEQLKLEPLLLRLPMPDDYAVDEDRLSARYCSTYFS
uniref:Nuclear pore complex protein Nup98-Nup96 n=1 Tax=Plectus sambesii TaxID=2011161 RepID=A0A914XMM5_9BILA